MRFKKSDIPENSGKVVSAPGEESAAVFRDAEGAFHVFATKCPHAACPVHWSEREKAWNCPCHGSRYEATGELKRGPAERGLFPKEFHEEGEEVVIDK